MLQINTHPKNTEELAKELKQIYTTLQVNPEHYQEAYEAIDYLFTHYREKIMKHGNICWTIQNNAGRGTTRFLKQYIQKKNMGGEKDGLQSRQVPESK